MTRHAVPARQRGLALLDLLTALFIIGVLAAAAVPMYLEAVHRAIRAEAQVQLLQAASFMKRFHAINDTYRIDRDGRGIAEVMPDSLRRSPAQGRSLYTIEFGDGLSSATASGFQLVMKPVPGGRMAGDACGAFTIDSLGRRGVSGARATWQECWK